MKLTREGAARLGRHESRGFPIGDFDFKPEDFDGRFQVWNTFDETPPEGKTFLIRQDHHRVYFGRIVQGRILTCFVFQNLNGLTNGAIVESGKPLADWVKAQKPRVPNGNTELVWAGFDWQA